MIVILLNVSMVIRLCSILYKKDKVQLQSVACQLQQVLSKKMKQRQACNLSGNYSVLRCECGFFMKLEGNFCAMRHQTKDGFLNSIFLKIAMRMVAWRK